MIQPQTRHSAFHQVATFALAMSVDQSGLSATAQSWPFKPLWLLADSCRSPSPMDRQTQWLHVRPVIAYFEIMETSHSDLQRRVDAEIDAYVAPEHPRDAMGSAPTASWFSDRLIEMRAALVPPHNAKIRDGDDETGEVIIKDVIVVADDGAWVIVAYDPKATTFVLAAHDTDLDYDRGVDAVAVGIRGSAVDCFLAA